MGFCGSAEGRRILYTSEAVVADTIIVRSEECGYPDDLGLDSMGQVVRASRKLCLSPDDSGARAVLDSYREFRLACLKTSLLLLRSVQLPNRTLISARLKRIESINRKITRNQFGTFSVSQMDDIIGFRIICESYLEAVNVADRLAGLNRAIKKDYIGRSHPNGSGYRAIHVIAKFDQPFRSSSVVARFEIQIRTWLQHLWACWCESQGEQVKEFNANLDQCVDKESVETIGSLISMSKLIAEWEEKIKEKVKLGCRGVVTLISWLLQALGPTVKIRLFSAVLTQILRLRTFATVKKEIFILYFYSASTRPTLIWNPC